MAHNKKKKHTYQVSYNGEMIGIIEAVNINEVFIKLSILDVEAINNVTITRK